MPDDLRAERLRIARRLGLHRFTRNENGQMMLLTAFVLVIGFVALTAMVARMSQLSEGTRQSADRPIYIEAEAVARGVENNMRELNILIAPREDGGNMDTFNEAVTGSMHHMTVLESARGYRLRLTDPAEIPGHPVGAGGSNPWCDDSSGQAVVSTSFSLGDPSTSISFTISYTPRDIYTETDPSLDHDTNAVGGPFPDGSGNPADYPGLDYEDGKLQDGDDPTPDVVVTSCSGADTAYP